MDVLVRARRIESFAGVATCLAGLWIAAGALLLDPDGVSSYWAAVLLGSLIAVTGGVRASAPLRLPGLSVATVALAAVLVVEPMVSRWGGGSLLVQMNQVVVGFAIALGSVAAVSLRPAPIR
ncbi:hypothetical protein AB0E59_36050 [Lentzea sp. NPDC034063]|uniref:hypothetical protein n=1 Tax=unclassified Lentzea TaxID=2643253 RepID=UPI0033C05AE1